MGRHPGPTVLLVVLLAMTPLWVSLGSALENPSFGVSLPARLAEWVRDNGGKAFVVWSENLWYSHHAPPIGGLPDRSLIPRLAPGGATSRGTRSSVQGSVPGSAAGSKAGKTAPIGAAGGLRPAKGTTSSGAASKAGGSLVPLAKPANLQPFASPAIAGEGVYQPVGRKVNGMPAIYETFMRPDAVHTSIVDGVAWMDTRLLRATLYSGSYIPGGGPYPYTAPISPLASKTLVAAFNAGFRMQDANGGYFTDGKVVFPLRKGAASFVIYRNGSVKIGAWGSDVTMTPGVVSVRQNLVLLVDHGHAVSGLNANDTTVWGDTLYNQIYVWRSGVGVTAQGALVYVGGPGLNITDLANLLVRAGAVRAMELDINTDWVNFASFDPSTAYGQASTTNGTELLPQMSGGPGRYFASWWTRDFFTMSAR